MGFLLSGKGMMNSKLSNTVHCIGKIAESSIVLELPEADWGVTVTEIIGSCFGIASQFAGNPALGGTLLGVDLLMSGIGMKITPTDRPSMAVMKH